MSKDKLTKLRDTAEVGTLLLVFCISILSLTDI